MAYKTLKNKIPSKKYREYSLEHEALKFVRERCEGLKFDSEKAEAGNRDWDGNSIRPNQIPYNMEKDIDRLCMENAIGRFLKTGKKEDAFDVYFCYLEMFVGDYEKTRRMIELLSEFEANGSSLLMKHRDHYAHSVYVFCMGLAIYESNSIYRKIYKKFYDIDDDHRAACHYLEYWGLASLFHDIGYPFELPFEQVCSYFEVEGDERSKRPFMAYRELKSFTAVSEKENALLRTVIHDRSFKTTDELFAYLLADRLGKVYSVDEKQMQEYLGEKPARPDLFGHFMDHAYFSATILFQKLFREMGCRPEAAHLDALTAILMHNSLYKFCIANFKMASGKSEMHLSDEKDGNKAFKADVLPLAYMLMLCDELQCWDRISYGRNSKKGLHPMGCSLDLSGDGIKITYLFDEREMEKAESFKDEYITWLEQQRVSLEEKIAGGKPEHTQHDSDPPCLKSYSGMFIRRDGKTEFQSDIEKIVDLTEIKLCVTTGFCRNVHTGNGTYLSNSNFINLYNFAVVLNGRWNNDEWKRARDAGQQEKYLGDRTVAKRFEESFKSLSLEYKLSNINQAKAFAKYLNEIGCFYTDKPVDFEVVDRFTEEDLVKIGHMEHRRWLQEHYDMGWIYGNPDPQDRDFMRQHKDMIPDSDGLTEVTAEDAMANYERLDKAEQDKDTEPMECMLALLKMYDGLRIYRLS